MTDNDYNYKSLDDLIHSRIRLSILSILVREEAVDFNTLKQLVKATDGNISIHLKKLEEAEYIEAEKKFVDRKPKTVYRLSVKGKEAFTNYVKRIEEMIHT